MGKPSPRAIAIWVVLLVTTVGAQSSSSVQKSPLLGDQTDGSRARPVHSIPLRDAGGEVIRPTDRPLLPFSPASTCGADCHDVATITRGFHFNTTGGGPTGARRGEPWILVDPDTATQLPLSYHPWSGVFHPGQVGITPWKFAKLFGARTPGGIRGDGEPGAELKARWAVSGELEANCLACHDASPGYDQAEYERQVALENFRWAASAASGLSAVTGAAREMPNSFDHLLPTVEDALVPRMPSVVYSPERFLPGAKVVFDIVRDVPARRCYFCHSNADVEHTGQGRWNADQDIHLARGMTCVDCHRNGLDHEMTRGYEGEPRQQAGAFASAAVSCSGCHLATESERVFARGRLGAPYPRHAGLPPIHFKKLSCTACHSGPRPAATMRRLKTSQAHRLGGLNVNKSSQVLPHLYYPVFARREDGTTVPNRMVWPAYWGRLSHGTVQPIAPDHVKKVMARARVALKPMPDGGWPSLDTGALSRILTLLAAEAGAGGTPVYVSGGRLHRLDASGAIAAEPHQAAQPYLWPMAHDVRPAALALGARGCEDCHDTNAPIFFGRVPVDSALVSDRGETWTMARFQKDLDIAYVADFARTFRYRPWLKGATTAAAAVLALFVLAYATAGVGRLSAAAGAARWTRVAVNVVGAASCAVAVASAFPELRAGTSFTGYRLVIHVGAAAILTGSAVMVALYWADRNRFGRADWSRVRRPIGVAARSGATSYVVLLRKLCFWVAIAALIPAVASVTLAMFPILASVRQGSLLLVHRYSVVAFAVSALLFTCLAFGSWVRGPHRAA